MVPSAIPPTRPIAMAKGAMPVPLLGILATSDVTSRTGAAKAAALVASVWILANFRLPIVQLVG